MEVLNDTEVQIEQVSIEGEDKVGLVSVRMTLASYDFDGRLPTLTPLPRGELLSNL